MTEAEFLRELKKTLISIRRNDKTSYAYARMGENSQNRDGKEPPAGKRWNTPIELVDSFMMAWKLYGAGKKIKG